MHTGCNGGIGLLKIATRVLRAGRTFPILSLWSSLSKPSKRLIALGAAFLVMMVAAVGLMMADIRAMALRDAEDNLGKLGIAIAEQTTRSIQFVDLIFQELNNSILIEGVTTPE